MSEGSSSDDDFQVLSTAPTHLKRKINQSQPIEIFSSDDEPGPSVKAPSRAGTRDIAGPSKRTKNTSSSRSRSAEVKAEIKSPSIPTNVDLPSEVTPENLLPTLLDILPDIDTIYAISSLRTELQKGSADRAVMAVVEGALDMEAGYPKMKGKSVPAIKAGDYFQKDYRKEQRCGEIYTGNCIMTLEEKFASIPSAQ